jgi:hypothetical protein
MKLDACLVAISVLAVRLAGAFVGLIYCLHPRWKRKGGEGQGLDLLQDCFTAVVVGGM